MRRSIWYNKMNARIFQAICSMVITKHGVVHWYASFFGVLRDKIFEPVDLHARTSEDVPVPIDECTVIDT